MDKLLFFQEKLSFIIDNLLSPRLDGYLIYGFVLSLLLILLFSLSLLIRKESLLLPAFFLALILTSGFFYLREHSPWSFYLKPSPPARPAPEPKPLKIKKLGEADFIPRENPASPEKEFSLP